MENKKVLAGMLIGAIATGVFIALATLSLREKTFIRSSADLLLVGDKNLCDFLTKDYLQSQLPQFSFENVVPVSERLYGGANCVYFGNDGVTPILKFFYDSPNLNAIKDRQGLLGAGINDVSAIGDEALFSEILMPGEIRLNSLFFRIGSIGYNLESARFSESELITVAKEAVDKLTQ